ncbi:hypothetical protein RND81_03G170000 [Saponaria officinalis]|uniref:FAS1 domain-containing protein n=1 Tax=Saponaria officinalis TaxID=3572 RepID=A0AAW1M7N0_SAPOF
MKIVKLFNNSIAVILLVISVCCMIIVILSVGKLPEVKTRYSKINPKKLSEIKGVDLMGKKLGKFGEMMIEMLPNDLAFTVFVPSEMAFERDLKIRVNHSLTPDHWDNTYATVSRVLGFSSVPRKIYADLVGVGKEVAFDSISGFALHVSKEVDGVLVVNRVRSERVDIEKGEVVVHVMDGVIMDAEFEQSV